MTLPAGPRPSPLDSYEPPDPRELDLSAELASPTGDFLTSIDLNHILGNLFIELAANRVSTRRASALAYICANLLRTQPDLRRQIRFMELAALDFVTKAVHGKVGSGAAPDAASASDSGKVAAQTHAASAPPPPPAVASPSPHRAHRSPASPCVRPRSKR